MAYFWLYIYRKAELNIYNIYNTEFKIHRKFPRCLPHSLFQTPETFGSESLKKAPKFILSSPTTMEHKPAKHSYTFRSMAKSLQAEYIYPIRTITQGPQEFLFIPIASYSANSTYGVSVYLWDPVTNVYNKP